MLRALITAVAFFSYGIWTIPKYIYCNFFIKDLNKQRQYAKKITSKWSKILFKAAKSDIHVSGVENIPNDSAVLFVANHQSVIDIPAILTSMNRPVGFVAKIELKKIPLLHHWISKTGSVYIDRNDIRQSMKAIMEATDNLKAGLDMAIFPEGTRSRDGEIHEFKRGSLKPAQRTGVPIIPVAIDGTNAMLEKLNKWIVQPNEIKISIGEPIYLEQLSKEDQKDINVILQNKIQHMIDVMRTTHSS